MWHLTYTITYIKEIKDIPNQNHEQDIYNFNDLIIEMFYFLIVPIEGWLVEHPKIKIKSSIILNYRVNVQYAYSVNVTYLRILYPKVLNIMYFMWMLNNIHICRCPYPWFFNTLYIKLILHASNIWKNDLIQLNPCNCQIKFTIIEEELKVNGLGLSNIIWIKNLIIKTNMTKILKKNLCWQISNYRT
jgi:hypothetical protein